MPAATTVNGVFKYPVGRSFTAAKNNGPAELRVGAEMAIWEANFEKRSLETAQNVAIRDVTVRVEVESNGFLELKDGGGEIVGDEVEDETLIFSEGRYVRLKLSGFEGFIEQEDEKDLGFRRKRD